MTKEELKQGYQPKSCNLKNIVPPSVSTNVKPKKDGYTWEDLDKAWWEGFDNAKNKMEKRIADLEKENAELKKKKEEIEIMTNFCKACKKMHTDNLTKAKEIIKEVMNWYWETDICSDNMPTELRQKAEQFLSEVEK